MTGRFNTNAPLWPRREADSFPPGHGPVRWTGRDAAPVIKLDKVRTIRRSIRCFYFGLIGLLPVVGLGLAMQALRLHREVSFETRIPWRPPVVHWYWTMGALCMLGYFTLWGWASAMGVWLIFLVLQTYHLWRCAPVASCNGLMVLENSFRNPAADYLRWGMICAYGGWFNSLAAMLLLLCTVMGWAR